MKAWKLFEIVRWGSEDVTDNAVDDDYKSLLHLAMEARKESTIRMLLDGSEKRSINSIDKDGRTLLHLTAQAGDMSTFCCFTSIVRGSLSTPSVIKERLHFISLQKGNMKPQFVYS